MPERVLSPEPPSPGYAVAASSDAVFVLVDQDLWRSTDLETFEIVSKVPLDRPTTLDAHGSTLVAASSSQWTGACTAQGQPSQIAVSTDLGDSWSLIEAPVSEPNLAYPDRYWNRLVEVSTDGHLVLMFERFVPDEFVPYSRCLISELNEGWKFIGNNSSGLLINTGDEVRTFSVDELDLSEDDRAVLTGEVELTTPEDQFWQYDVEHGTWSEAYVPPGVSYVETDFVATSWVNARTSDGVDWNLIEFPSEFREIRTTEAAVVATGEESNWVSLDAGRTWEEFGSSRGLKPVTDAIEYHGTIFYFVSLLDQSDTALGYRDDGGELSLTTFAELLGRDIDGGSFLGVVDDAVVISSGAELLIGRSQEPPTVGP